MAVSRARRARRASLASNWTVSSDIVAFGVAPAGLIYMWAMRNLAPWSWAERDVCDLRGIAAGAFNVQVGTVDKIASWDCRFRARRLRLRECTLAYSYFELDSPRTICATAIILTAVLAFLMISRVPYPSCRNALAAQRRNARNDGRASGRGRFIFAMLATQRVCWFDRRTCCPASF